MVAPLLCNAAPSVICQWSPSCRHRHHNQHHHHHHHLSLICSRARPVLHCARRDSPRSEDDEFPSSSSASAPHLCQNVSRLPDVPWDCNSVLSTMFSYFSILHIPFGIGGISLLARQLHVEDLDPQIKAISLLSFQFIELAGAMWLIQSSLKESKISLQFWNFSFEDLGGSRGWLMTSAIGCAVILVIMESVSYFMGNPPTEGDGKQEALRVMLSGDTVTQSITYLTCCILTPCLEEIVYRGYLLQSLCTRFGWQLAVGISSLAFAVAHFNLLGMPNLFLVGCILGIAYTWSGNLAASYVIHALYNALILLSIASA